MSHQASPTGLMNDQASPKSGGTPSLGHIQQQIPSSPSPMPNSMKGSNTVFGGDAAAGQRLPNANTESRKRRLSAEPHSRPQSRRQIERPVSRVIAPTQPIYKILQDIDQAPNDQQFREYLKRTFPNLPIDSFDFEKTKSQYFESKSKVKFMSHLARHFIEGHRRNFQGFTQMPRVNPGWLETAEPRQLAMFTQAHQMELLSLMLQRVIREYAVEIHQQERQYDEDQKRGQEAGLSDDEAARLFDHSPAVDQPTSEDTKPSNTGTNTEAAGNGAMPLTLREAREAMRARLEKVAPGEDNPLFDYDAAGA